MQSNSSPSSNHEKLLKALSQKHSAVKEALKSNHQKAGVWLDENQISFIDLKKKSRNLLAGVSVMASVLLSPPPESIVTTGSQIEQKLNDSEDTGLQDSLPSLLPPIPGHASVINEQKISEIIQEKTGIRAIPQYEGQRLNHTYGWMGYEQHLKRYPGDDIAYHDEEVQAGIAPGLGAWGYFVHSKQDLSPKDILKEKYYFAVQTLYLPNWNSDWKTLSRWYKHRKMIAINPTNGKAIVGVIADAGPAKFTGKQFGGSPEAMKYLELVTGKKKGKVLLYFIDDPNDAIPLGPVKGKYPSKSV